MKKITIVIVTMMLYRPLHGQVVIALLFGDKLNTGKLEFGLVVAPASTGITHIDSRHRGGLNLGLYFNIRPDKKISIHAEAVAKGAFGARGIFPYATGNDTLDNLFVSGKVERVIKAFSLPIMARYAVSRKFFIDLGIQPDMMLGAKDIFSSTVNGQDLDYTVKINDQVTLLDFGLTGGVFYKFKDDIKSMGLGVRYYQGLTDILKSTAGTQANTLWQFTVTIPIGAGKASAQNAAKKAAANP